MVMALTSKFVYYISRRVEHRDRGACKRNRGPRAHSLGGHPCPLRIG